MKFFLDCGAFTGFTKGEVIDIDQYMSYVNENDDLCDLVASLDVIGDDKASYANYKIMLEEGFTPIPCFHYGEDISYLKKYCKKAPYIALGGMVSMNTAAQTKFLARVFDYIPSDIKVHGYGITSTHLLKKFPWHSTDSSSWAKIGGFGCIQIPVRKNHKWNFDQPFVVCFTEDSPSKAKFNAHYDTLTPTLKKMVNSWLAYIDFSTDEMRTCYKCRWAANICYYNEMGNAHGVKVYTAGSDGAERNVSILKEVVEYRLMSYFYLKKMSNMLRESLK